MQYRNVQIIRVLISVLLAATLVAPVLLVPAPAAAAPFGAPFSQAGSGIEGQLLTTARSVGRLVALVGVLLLGLQLLGPGQSILAKIGLQVPPDYLVSALLGVILLGMAPDIVTWLFGFAGGTP